MARRALITGATGFVGSHLAEHLLAAGWEVSGFDIRPAWPPGTPALPVKLRTGDLRRSADIGAALEEFRPDMVFHLAAEAASTRAAADPARAVGATIEATVVLCEAVRRLDPRPELFITGSAAVYGRVAAADLPIRETRSMRPISSYGAAKAAQELYGWQYRDGFGLRVFVTRSFNAAGPRQSPDFFLPHVCREVARREAGADRGLPVPVGSLDVERDYLDVRDMVRAYAALAQTPAAEGKPVNVCSGRTVRLRTVADLVRSLARVPVSFATDAGRVPASQADVLVGDPGLLASLTGFAPRIPVEDTVAAVLEYPRGLVREAGGA